MPSPRGCQCYGKFNVEGDLEARLKRVLIYFIGPGLFSATVAAQGACAVSFYPPLLPERPASPVLPPLMLTVSAYLHVHTCSYPENIDAKKGAEALGDPFLKYLQPSVPGGECSVFPISVQNPDLTA